MQKGFHHNKFATSHFIDSWVFCKIQFKPLMDAVFLSESIDCEQEGHTWNQGKCGNQFKRIPIVSFFKRLTCLFLFIMVEITIPP